MKQLLMALLFGPCSFFGTSIAVIEVDLRRETALRPFLEFDAVFPTLFPDRIYPRMCLGDGLNGSIQFLRGHNCDPMITTACVIGSKPVAFQKLKMKYAMRSTCLTLSGSLAAKRSFTSLWQTLNRDF